MTESTPDASGASTATIRNCRFAFRCTQQWDTLSAGAHPRQRYCSDCERHVVLCETNNELRTALRRNDCVAIPTGLLQIRIESHETTPHMVGQVTPKYGYRAGHTVPTFRKVDSADK